MLLLVDLADHFHDGHEGGLLILAEDGIVVDHGDDPGKIGIDGFFIAEPIFWRGGLLFEDAGFQASAGEGELVGVDIVRHGLDLFAVLDGYKLGIDAVLEGVGIFRLGARPSAGSSTANAAGGFVGHRETPWCSFNFDSVTIIIVNKCSKSS